MFKICGWTHALATIVSNAKIPKNFITHACTDRISDPARQLWNVASASSAKILIRNCEEFHVPCLHRSYHRSSQANMKCSFNFWRKNPKEFQRIFWPSDCISDPKLWVCSQSQSGSGKNCQRNVATRGENCGKRQGKVKSLCQRNFKKIKQVSLISRYIGITGFNLEEFHKVVSVISLWIVWSSPWNFCSRWKGARYDRDQGGRCSQLCEECFRWYSNEGEWGSSLLSLFPRYLFNICSIFVEYFLYISIALSLFPRYLPIFV